MKRIIIFLLLCNPLFLQAGIIVTKSDGNLEDVSNITVGKTEITYKQDGEIKSINRDEVSAVLYDNGKYEEIKSIEEVEEEETQQNNTIVTTTTSDISDNNRIYNVLAFGTMAMNFYVRNEEYDGARVEWRVVSNTSEVANTDYQYLGTTPFAYATSGSYDYIKSMYKKAAGFLAEQPLIIDGMTAKNTSKVKIEFRVTKEGYEPLICTPIRKIEFVGLFLYLPLNKLKPLKEGVAPMASTDALQTSSAVAITAAGANTEEPSSTTDANRIIPQICSTEGKNVYDATYKEGMAQSMRRGYSKSQASIIANEFAEQAKQKAIDECYETIVVRDEEFALGTSNANAIISGSLFTLYPLSETSKQIIPQACYDEGKKAYDAAYEEAEAKALRQGYSKSQAKTVAGEAGEKAKKSAIDDWYKKLVIIGIDYNPTEVRTIKDREAKDINDKSGKEKSLKSKNEQASQDIPPSPSIAAITKISNKEYVFQGNSLDKKAYEEFIQNNCPEAWKKYHQGKQTIIAGWTFFISGIALTSMWGLLGVQQYNSYWVPEQGHYEEVYNSWTGNYEWTYVVDREGEMMWKYEIPVEAEISAIVLGSLGAAFTFFSIPMLAVGYHVKNNAYKVYNNKCAQSGSQVSLNFQANQNGLGVALRF